MLAVQKVVVSIPKEHILIKKNSKSLWIKASAKCINVQKVRARTNAKSRCLSVKGVNLWNKCDKGLKVCNSPCQFKKMYKNKVINNYMTQYK